MAGGATLEGVEAPRADMPFALASFREREGEGDDCCCCCSTPCPVPCRPVLGMGLETVFLLQVAFHVPEVVFHVPEVASPSLDREEMTLAVQDVPNICLFGGASSAAAWLVGEGVLFGRQTPFSS